MRPRRRRPLQRGYLSSNTPTPTPAADAPLVMHLPADDATGPPTWARRAEPPPARARTAGLGSLAPLGEAGADALALTGSGDVLFPDLVISLVQLGSAQDLARLRATSRGNAAILAHVQGLDAYLRAAGVLAEAQGAHRMACWWQTVTTAQVRTLVQDLPWYPVARDLLQERMDAKGELSEIFLNRTREALVDDTRISTVVTAGLAAVDASLLAVHSTDRHLGLVQGVMGSILTLLSAAGACAAARSLQFRARVDALAQAAARDREARAEVERTQELMREPRVAARSQEEVFRAHALRVVAARVEGRDGAAGIEEPPPVS